jgi:hypothetical protein
VRDDLEYGVVSAVLDTGMSCFVWLVAKRSRLIETWAIVGKDLRSRAVF